MCRVIKRFQSTNERGRKQAACKGLCDSMDADTHVRARAPQRSSLQRGDSALGQERMPGTAPGCVRVPKSEDSPRHVLGGKVAAAISGSGLRQHHVPLHVNLLVKRSRFLQVCEQSGSCLPLLPPNPTEPEDGSIRAPTRIAH